MNALNLHMKLQEAWETSTMNNNRFAPAVEAIDWDERFEADGELYFILDGYEFATQTLDPFGEHNANPCGWFDGDWEPHFFGEW